MKRLSTFSFEISLCDASWWSSLYVKLAGHGSNDHDGRKSVTHMLALTASAWKGHTSLPPTCHWPKQATKIPSEFGREGRIASPQGGRLEQVKPGCWVTRHTVPQWLPVALRIWSKTLARPTRLPVTVSAELSNFTSPFPSLGVCSLATLLFPHSLNVPCTLFWGSVNIQIPLSFFFFCPPLRCLDSTVCFFMSQPSYHLRETVPGLLDWVCFLRYILA